MTAIYAFQLSLKILLLAQGLPRLLTMLFHTIVLSCVIELPFRNSRADWKISKFAIPVGLWYRCLACCQAASSDACIIDRRWHIVLSMLALICAGINEKTSYAHLLSWYMSKHLTPRWLLVIMPSLYGMHLARLLKLRRYSPSLHLLWTLGMTW